MCMIFTQKYAEIVDRFCIDYCYCSKCKFSNSCGYLQNLWLFKTVVIQNGGYSKVIIQNGGYSKLIIQNCGYLNNTLIIKYQINFN